jgi:hypothetical protein
MMRGWAGLQVVLRPQVSHIKTETLLHAGNSSSSVSLLPMSYKTRQVQKRKNQFSIEEFRKKHPERYKKLQDRFKSTQKPSQPRHRKHIGLPSKKSSFIMDMSDAILAQRKAAVETKKREMDAAAWLDRQMGPFVQD